MTQATVSSRRPARCPSPWRDTAAAIDARLVRRLIAEQFPRYRALPVAAVVPGGHDNRTFRVGDSLCARLPSAGRYASRPPIEYAWLPRLAGHLPLPIPHPVALGAPGAGYPWHWTLNRWIPGKPATPSNIRDLSGFARRLASFLNALQGVDTAGAPAPGPENFYRGGNLSTYAADTDRLLDRCRGRVDHHAALETWLLALESRWQADPVWVHGDIAPGNLLVRDGQLHAVIDFGQLAAGDPACDLTVAWTLLDQRSRTVFRAQLQPDELTWRRARGWALWKQLLALDAAESAGSRSAQRARRAVRAIREITTPPGRWC